MTITTLGKSKIFTCGRCKKLISYCRPKFSVSLRGTLLLHEVQKSWRVPTCQPAGGKGFALRGDIGRDLLTCANESPDQTTNKRGIVSVTGSKQHPFRLSDPRHPAGPKGVELQEPFMRLSPPVFGVTVASLHRCLSDKEVLSRASSSKLCSPDTIKTTKTTVSKNRSEGCPYLRNDAVIRITQAWLA
jgi:hypothetical protein